MFLKQPLTNPPSQPLPLLIRLRERIHQRSLMIVPLGMAIQLLFAQYILDESIAINQRAMRVVVFILHHSTKDLKDRGDATATTNHDEVFHAPFASIDATAATA